MSLDMVGMLTDQEAWDVTTFMNSHERPQYLRVSSPAGETHKKYND